MTNKNRSKENERLDLKLKIIFIYFLKLISLFFSLSYKIKLFKKNTSF